MKRLSLALALSCLLIAQEKVDEATTARIRSEEMEHSQIMHTLHMLTDRYGPRVTGTPNHEAAVQWVISETTKWGLKNAHREAWDFGHPGWSNERASGFLVSPVKQNLKFEVLAWTPSTNGTVTASTVQMVPPQGPPAPPPPATDSAAGGRGAFGGRGGAPQRLGPTKDEMALWIAANRDKVRGKIVLVGKAAVIPVDFNPPAKRRADDQVTAMYDPNNPNAGRGGFGGRGGGGRGGRGEADPNRLTAQQVGEQLDAMLLEGGAVLRINDAARGEGIIVAQQHRAYDPAKTVPTVILRNDDYGRIERLLADGEDVKAEFTIVNHVYPEGKTSYNVVAEIPGTDKAEEVVMLGGHLDSWHSGTGATDNAIGSSIMLEAVRLIETLGLKPRRTIRVALWSGEEEGLLGSLAYVKQHFGTAEDPKPEFAKLDCYFNVDTGTGRLRGAGIFGPPETAAVLRPVLSRFADWGMAGANTTNSRVTGGTDSTSFNNAGLPGIGMSQDPIEYNTLTHHTNLDTYERIIPDDVQKAAAIIAASVWHVANRDQMVPRFAKDQMPAPVAPR
ncbi:MAG TPA: M20/M25/M40 family metallo-hydrolase [Candidatus Acidoferrales bacterium]|nr:M20/M25/M40 family metallo-hydrolase [Candidatus Acidoferrales bacterium]